MEMESRKAYTEVLAILEYMSPSLVEKISPKVMDVFEENKLLDYKVSIDPTRALHKQNLCKKTFSILSVLSLMYWCNGNNRSEILRLYAVNQKLNEVTNN